MKRKWIAIALGSTLLVSLALLYSLVGVMTGVYACPGAGVIMQGNPYAIRRGADWYGTQIGWDVATPEARKIDLGKWSVHHGTWIVTFTDQTDGSTISAYPPWNLADVYRLTFGRHRDLGR